MSSNISFDTNIEPNTACSASILLGNSLKTSLTMLKLLFIFKWYMKKI